MRAPVRVVLLLVSLLVATLLAPTMAAAEDRDPSEIFFPVQVTDQLRYSDTWGAARSGGRSHLGVDVMSPAMTPAFAAQSGTIYDYEGACRKGEYCSSYYLLLRGDDGRMYFYVHLNNDTPGRPNGCDGRGGAENAFSPRLVDALRAGRLKGLRVERGEHIGYAGSSGNSGCRVDHVHFEVWNGTSWAGKGDRSINPYPPVRAAHVAGNTWGPNWSPGEPEPSSRVYGQTRIDTSVQLSRRAFGDGARTVVIAPATTYQEALVAAPLAATLDAPILLVEKDGRDAVTPAVADEIDRLGADYAIVVGATDVIGDVVLDQLAARTRLESGGIRRIGHRNPAVLSADVAEVVLRARGIEVPPREGGSSRSVQYANLIPPLQEQIREREAAAAAGDEPEPVDPLVAAGTHPRGLGWPDALSASVLGARQRTPVLLTPSDRLHDDIERVLSADGIRTPRIVGGEAAVEARVETQIANRTGRTARRLAGENRYRTSQKVQAEIARDGAPLQTLSLATGLNFPDALAAGPALATLNRSFVLVDGAQAHPSVQSWIASRADRIDRLEAIGGTTAISDSVLRQAAVAANEDS